MIRPAKLKNTVIHQNGDTWDIVSTVLKADKQSRKDTENFSKQFTRDKKGLLKLWLYVKNNFTYKEDENGQQWIKSPARLFHDKKGDCKSFTIFINSVLQNLKIDYITRFISQNSDKDPTHVYSVAILGDEKIILDAVYYKFNEEPRYTKKYDYMTKISYLNGVKNFQSELERVKKFNFAEASEAERQEVLIKEMFLIESLNNPDSTQAAAAAENFVNFELEAADKTGINEQAAAEAEAADAVNGVLSNAKKKILNTVARVILPRVAPAFLYTQVDNKYLSQAAQAKKRKQERIKNALKKAGISSQTFNMLITNSIKSKAGKTPLELVKSFYKPLNNKKIGFAGAGVVIAQAATFLTGLVQSVVKLVKGFKKTDAPTAADAPSPSDFNGFTDPDQQVKTVKTPTPTNTETATVTPIQTSGTGAGAGTGTGADSTQDGNKKMLLIAAAAAAAFYFYTTQKK